MFVDVAQFAAAALYPSNYYRYWMFLDPLTWLPEIWACVEVGNRLFDSVSKQPDQRFRIWTVRTLWALSAAVGITAVALSVEPYQYRDILLRNFSLVVDLKRCYVLILFVATVLIVALFWPIHAHTLRRGSAVISAGMLTHAKLLAIYFALQTAVFWTVQAWGNSLGVRQAADVTMTIGGCAVFIAWASILPARIGSAGNRAVNTRDRGTIGARCRAYASRPCDRRSVPRDIGTTCPRRAASRRS
jgi:hypothetical protein